MEQQKLASSQEVYLQAEWESVNVAKRTNDAAIIRHIEFGTEKESDLLPKHMHAILPRELWDMVYGFIIAEGPATVKESDVHSSSISSLHDLTLESPLSRAIESQGYGNLLGDNTIAEDSLRELADLWYKTSVFCFTDHSALCVFTPYFENTEKLLSHILKERLDTDPDPCRLIKAVRVIKRVWDVQSMNNQFQALADDFELIHRLKACTSINLVLIFKRYDPLFTDKRGRAATLAWEFKTVFPVIGELIEAGYKFTVYLSLTLELEVLLEHLSARYWTQKFQKLADVSLLSGL
jgi:hypothetical protein